MSKYLRISVLLLFVSLTIAVTSSSSVGQVPINIGASDIESTAQDALYIHNLTTPVLSGSNWVTFKWDPESLVFYPTDLGADNITPPYSNLVGSYRLKAFTVIYSNGTVINERNSNFSGIMIIGTSKMSQTVTINGKSGSWMGPYTIKFKGLGGGTLLASDSTRTYPAVFWTAPHEIMTYSGIQSLDASTSAEDWDQWEKTSDMGLLTPSISAAEEGGSKPFFWLGELLYNSVK